MTSINTESDFTVGFVGIGLIGGSIAKSIKQNFKNSTIIAHNRSREPLNMAIAEGVVDIAADNVGEEFSVCDFIFLCAPVEYNVMYLEKLKAHIKPDCILTDVGSVKGNIHIAAKEIGIEGNFIGGHPMAGSEKTRYESSSATLLNNAYYILTTTDKTKQSDIDKLNFLISKTGAKSIVIGYDYHDYVVAAISHVPHIIASCLVNMVADNDDSDETMKTVAAGGFKDITRIASSSPEVWQQICSANSANIVKLIDKYITYLSTVRNHLADNDSDYIFDMFENSRSYRDSI